MNPATKALEDIKEASRLPNRTKKALSEEAQSPSDLKAIAKRDELCTLSEGDKE